MYSVSYEQWTNIKIMETIFNCIPTGTLGTQDDKTNKNITKTQCNMCWTPLCTNKHNNVNKTWSLLQTTRCTYCINRGLFSCYIRVLVLNESNFKYIDMIHKLFIKEMNPKSIYKSILKKTWQQNLVFKITDGTNKCFFFFRYTAIHPLDDH